MFQTRFVVMLLMSFTALMSDHADAVQRTHVSAAIGSDSNTATNCTAAAPCRFFQAAMSVTDTDGEVVVLDSGGYGAVTITKSLALIAPTGVYAGISVFPNTHGVTIATAGVNAVLRGITINSQGGINGINMTNGASLSVENCVISNFGGNGNGTGISVVTAAKVRILDALLRNNASGIVLQTGANAIIARTTVLGSIGAGIGVFGVGPGSGTINAVISDSVFSGNNVAVFGQTQALGWNVRVSVSRSQFSNNTFGVVSQTQASSGTAAATISENIITQNDVGILQFGSTSTLESLGNNTIRQNTTSDTRGTITMAGTQ